MDNTTFTPEEEAVLEEDTMHGKFLVFSLDGQEYALPIRCVIDIINVQPITRVPNCPDFVRGITNLRGKVIPIVDVRLRFGKEAREYTERTCIVVVEEDEMPVGLIIDAVSEVLYLPDDAIAPPPAFQNSAEARFIQGIGKSEGGVKLILNCRNLLDEEKVSNPEEDFPA